MKLKTWTILVICSFLAMCWTMYISGDKTDKYNEALERNQAIEQQITKKQDNISNWKTQIKYFDREIEKYNQKSKVLEGKLDV